MWSREVRKRGREVCWLDRGQRLTEAALALAASVGQSRVQVFVRPRVAILTTGDEIVGVDAAPGPTQIRNSNSYSLAAQVLRAGGQPVLLPVAPDEPQALRQLIELGLKSDLLLMTGGVSMGRYDLVEQALSELHAEFFFTGAKIQPGRPVVFGKCVADTLVRERPGRYFFGLPGNPVSTMVTFELFARPMVEALAGQSPPEAHIPPCSAEIGNSRQDRPHQISPRNLVWRVRELAGRVGRVAGIGRHRRDRAGELLCCDSSGPREHCRGRVDRRDDAVAPVSGRREAQFSGIDS